MIVRESNIKESLLGTIPTDWDVKTLDEICDRIWIGLVTTMTKFYVKKGITLIRNSDIKENFIDINKCIQLDPEFSNKHNKYLVKMDDIVTVHTGDVGTSCVISKELSPAQGFATINSRLNKQLILPEFYSAYLNSDFFKYQVQQVITGDGRKNLNLKDFIKLMIVFPPLPEQRKIAEIISKIDNLIQINKIKLEKISLLKDALIQNLLFKGLDLHTYQQKSIGILPTSWKIVGINSVCKFIKRGPSLATNSLGKGIRYITSGNIVNDKISLETDFKFLDNFEGIDKCLIQKDDLILNCVNSEAKLASSALYKNNISSIVGFNNYALTLNLDKCLPSFIFYWTKTSNFHNQVKSFSKPAINQVSFSKKDLEKIQIPLPPLEEQFKICQIIDPIVSLQEELQIKIKKYISFKRGLANDLLLGRKKVNV